MKNNKIYIYAGPYVADPVTAMMRHMFEENFARHGLQVEPLTAEGVLNECWIDDAFALIWGGGEGTLFRKAMSPDGTFRKDILQRAHENGVHYAGFCGGAFMGFKTITFQGVEGYDKSGEGFGLYNRKSPGAVIGLTPSNFSGHSDSAAIIPMQHRRGQMFHSLYCCGPYFPLEELPKEAIPLATTTHPITGQEYILSVQIPAKNGYGSVSLYGNHPEFSADFIALRTLQTPSLPAHDERLRHEAYQHRHGIVLAYNLLIHDLKTGMGLDFKPGRLMQPLPRPISAPA